MNEPWGNPYDLGPVRNWQETFGSHGKLWWLTWALPSLPRKRKNSSWQVSRPARNRLASSWATTLPERAV